MALFRPPDVLKRRPGERDVMSAVDSVGAPTRRDRLWFFTAAASIAIGIIPIIVLETWFGVPRKISVGYGILAFVVGTAVVKVPIYQSLVERVLRPRMSTVPLAAVQGVLSAISELGVAALFIVFVVPRLTWWQVVGFGVGAGACEAIMLPFISNHLKGTSLEGYMEDVGRASAGQPAVRWLGVLERAWAMLLQVSTRGLVYLSIAGGSPAPALAAIAGFGAVDGTAYYWLLKRWRFDSLPVLIRVHIFLGAAACVMTAAFLFWSERIPVAAS
jgi:hypothetical protein